MDHSVPANTSTITPSSLCTRGYTRPRGRRTGRAQRKRAEGRGEERGRERKRASERASELPEAKARTCREIAGLIPVCGIPWLQCDRPLTIPSPSTHEPKAACALSCFKPTSASSCALAEAAPGRACSGRAGCGTSCLVCRNLCRSFAGQYGIVSATCGYMVVS